MLSIRGATILSVGMGVLLMNAVANGAASGIPLIGLRPLPFDDFHTYQGTYPFVSDQVDYLQCRQQYLFDGFSNRATLHEYYLPEGDWTAIDTNIYTNPLIKSIVNDEAAGRYPIGFLLARELMQNENQTPGPVPEQHRILFPEDVAVYRKLIADAYAAGRVARNDYKLIQLTSKTFDLTASPLAQSIIKAMDGYCVEFHNAREPGVPTDAIVDVVNRVANWTLEQPEGLTYVFLVGPIVGEYPIWRGTFNKLWDAGFPKMHERVYYQYNFIDKHEPKRVPGPETDPDTVTGNAKWLINEIKFGPDCDPPSAPTGISVSVGVGTTTLHWDNNPEHDLLAYNVYRSTGGAYSLIQTDLPRNRYTDLHAPNNTRCTYQVTAVDQWGNESGRSAVVAGTPRPVGSARLLIGWHSFSPPLPDSTPNVALPGIDGQITSSYHNSVSDAVQTGANSTDGRYGSGPAVSGGTVGALRVNGRTALDADDDRVHVTVSNNSGNSVILGTFHFDYAISYGDAPLRMELYYEGGDLDDAANTWIGSTLDGTAGSSPPPAVSTGDYADYEMTLAVLQDQVLDHGESATFMLRAGAWENKGRAGLLDNIAITQPPVDIRKSDHLNRRAKSAYHSADSADNADNADNDPVLGGCNSSWPVGGPLPVGLLLVGLLLTRRSRNQIG